MLLLSLYVSSSGEVLCFGDRGVVRIEPAHLQHCCDTDHAATVAALERVDYQHDCVDCSDILLDSPQWRQRSRFSDGQNSKPFAFTQAFWPTGERVITVGCSGHTLATGVDKRPSGPVAPAATVLRC